MFFRTSYGTKASIRLELLALHHTDPYTPSPINMNCIIYEEEEGGIVDEPASFLTKIPDFLLDE